MKAAGLFPANSADLRDLRHPHLRILRETYAIRKWRGVSSLKRGGAEEKLCDNYVSMW